MRGDYYLEAKERGIEFYFHQCGSMFIKDGINIGKWKLNEQIVCAEEIRHELEVMYKGYSGSALAINAVIVINAEKVFNFEGK